MSWHLKGEEELTRQRGRGGASRAGRTADAKALCKVWLDHRGEMGLGSWALGRIWTLFLGPGATEEY